MARTWLLVGAIVAGLGVAAGAWGAHGLEGGLKAMGIGGPAAGTGETALPKRLANYETAVRYQMYHALGILAVGLLSQRRSSRSAQAAGWLFLIGILLFSGCLYGWVFTGSTALVMIVPLGGLALIAGWFALAAAGWRTSSSA
jgi:uncharacterized membrane protein YgdD (TMEM256/DUF423 family)